MPMPVSSQLLKKIDQETLILTVNRRLARTLLQRLDQEYLASGEVIWPTPRVLPWATWLELCWEQLLDQAKDNLSTDSFHALALLTPWQERLLWEEVIAQSPQGETLLRISESAQNAQNAWKLLQEWRATLTEDDLYGHEDAYAFHAWSTHFVTHCQQKGWLDRARLIKHLTRHLKQLSLPATILLAGFQRPPPEHHAFFSSLAEFCVKIEGLFDVRQGETEHPNSFRTKHKPVRIGFSSVEAEILATAQWSRTQWSKAQESSTTGEKRGKIGIVVPALETVLPKVIEIFSRVFHPGKNPTTIDPQANLFNISLGIRLSETPLVKDALLLLTLAKKTLSLKEYTALLHAPFWHGGQSEWSKRSLLDARLRHKGLLQITKTRLFHEAQREEKGSPSCPLLASVMEQFIQNCSPTPKENTPPPSGEGKSLQREKPSFWGVRFAQWLSLLGWPGERSLTSGEHQTVITWQTALTTFSALDKIVGAISIDLALAHLTRLVAEVPFQPESGDAPIQILGLLESVGESYEKLWVMGLSEDVWPPPLEPNPFLPIAFQRHHGMPRSSFNLEMDYNSLVFNELMDASERVILSYPLQKDDQPLRPSPLIVNIPELEVKEEPPAEENGSTRATGRSRDQQIAKALGISLFPEYNQTIFESAQIVTSLDIHGPALQEKKEISTSVLKAQAHCPFQAFARFRMNANTPEEPKTGLEASQRGQTVHGAMTHLWQTVHDTQTDLETVCTTPDPWVVNAVQETLDQKMQQWPDALHPFFCRLEAIRLERLLRASVEMENTREEPFTIVGHEVDIILPLGNIMVRVRMDRIDQLQDGSMVILDYKTGHINIADWFGDRPADPQLPLYALAQQFIQVDNMEASKTPKSPVAALAFYQVKAGMCRFRGLARQEGVLPSVDNFQKYPHAATFPDWASLEAYWSTVLTSLGDAFLKGEAKRDPLPKACEFCDLHPLCRRDEVAIIPKTTTKHKAQP